MLILIFLVQFLHVYLSGGARWTEGQYIRSQPLFHRSLILRNVFTFECAFARYLPKSNATLCSEINLHEHFVLGPNIPDRVRVQASNLWLLIIDLKSNCLFQASQEVFCKRTDFIVLLVAELSNLRFRIQEEPTTLYDETHQRFCAMEQDFLRIFFLCQLNIVFCIFLWPVWMSHAHSSLIWKISFAQYKFRGWCWGL